MTRRSCPNIRSWPTRTPGSWRTVCQCSDEKKPTQPQAHDQELSNEKEPRRSPIGFPINNIIFQEPRLPRAHETRKSLVASPPQIFFEGDQGVSEADDHFWDDKAQGVHPAGQ